MGKFLAGLLVGMILLPAVLLVMAITGHLPVAATGHPPQWEKKLAHYVVKKSVARQAPVLKNPLQPTQENLLAGMKVFHETCDGCHGTAFTRSTWGTTDFYPPVPQ